jgi:AraC-like DNA-binding protein
VGPRPPGGQRRPGPGGRALADEVGWSRRHLIARFREQVGAPPKLVARVVRFQQVLRRLERDRDAVGAELAAACGYFDQAHLAREVRALAGLTPGELAARRAAEGMLEA